jgi:rare lipoprotein A
MKFSHVAIGTAAILFNTGWHQDALASHLKARQAARPSHVARHATTHAPANAGSFFGFATFYTESPRVASGGHYNPRGLTAAHRSLPFGTRVRITDPKSGRSVVVTINDRGPFRRGRVLDVSLAAARALGMINHGVLFVRAQVL